MHVWATAKVDELETEIENDVSVTVFVVLKMTNSALETVNVDEVETENENDVSVTAFVVLKMTNSALETEIAIVVLNSSNDSSEMANVASEMANVALEMANVASEIVAHHNKIYDSNGVF